MRVAYLSPVLLALLLSGCGGGKEEKKVPETMPPASEQPAAPAAPAVPAEPEAGAPAPGSDQVKPAPKPAASPSGQ